MISSTNINEITGHKTICLALITASAIITYIIFTIISLVDMSYKESKDLCKQSNLWIYLLISSYILLFTNKIPNNNVQNDAGFVVKISLRYIYSLAFTIWGLYEFLDIQCVEELEDSLLYIMSIISLSIHCLILFIMTVFFIALRN